MENKYHSKKNVKDEESIDITRWLKHLLNHWKWFVIAFLICFLIAKVYLKYSIPIYEISSIILVKEDKSKIDNALELFSETKNLDNEIVILKSRQLNEDVIFKKGLFIEVFSQGDYRLKEVSQKQAFDIIIDTKQLQVCDVEFQITILSENEYILSNDDPKTGQTYDYSKRTKGSKVLVPKFEKKLAFGEEYIADGAAFKILLNEKFKPNYIGQKYTFKFINLSQQAKNYISKLNIEKITKESTALELSIKSSIPEKAEIYINTLCTEYIAMGLEEKNQKAIRTIAFIDGMLEGITDSLNLIEDHLQGFRSNNQIINLDIETQEIAAQLSKLEEEKAVEKIKLKYYYYLQNYLIGNDSTEKIIAPSTIGIYDPLLNSLIAELSALKNEKTQLLISSTEENPYYKVIQGKIENNRRLLNENVKNIINNAELTLENLNKRISEVQAKVNKLPATERELLSITRKFNVQDQIYTYLLEYRAEAAIAKASNVADNKVIDTAIVDQKTFPNPTLIYLLTVLIALSIPGVIISFKFFLFSKIRTKEDVLEKTTIPISGIALHSARNKAESVSDYPRSIFTESLRKLKSNLSFFSEDKEIKTLLFTSSLSGEGKTFACINYAALYALFGKKVVLIDCDLRNPNVKKELKLKHDKKPGLSQIIAKDVPWQECVIRYENNNNAFDVIPHGIIPPNPYAIVESPKMHQLLKDLQEHYDIVIIDTSPVGIISDALNLMKFSDKIIYVLKHNYSNKNAINILNEIAYPHKKKNDFTILINNVPMKKLGAYTTLEGMLYKSNNYNYYTKYDEVDLEKENIFKRINQFLSTK